MSRLPLVLAIAVVNALEEGPLDLDELIVSLRRQQKECLKAAGQVYNGLAKMVKIRTNKVDPAVDR